MSDKIKHTVEIVAEMGADALVSFLKKCSTWSTEPKVIKSEKVHPPIKIGDRFRHANSGTEYEVAGAIVARDIYWVQSKNGCLDTVTGTFLGNLERLDD